MSENTQSKDDVAKAIEELSTKRTSPQRCSACKGLQHTPDGVRCEKCRGSGIEPIAKGIASGIDRVDVKK